MKTSNNTNRNKEEESSAVTLSDMEIFVFPRLLYALVLANIISPLIWKWREDPWFKDIEKKSPRNRIMRLKQYVMDNYRFNLDLETWGLTEKETEIKRFNPFIDKELLKSSNALFGYEGDRYYFDIDIRTHFGLDKYDRGIIPYWKTETAEAMDAFRHKNGYSTGAGECVSLSTLYAAALFIVARIPLNNIFLMATPLHSQNFVESGSGILTNNRRLVTKNMWFNGTPLSMKARRALENERITVLSHESGYIHTLYEKATICPDIYSLFSSRLKHFLYSKLDSRVFAGFLRSREDMHSCLQVKCEVNGKERYIGLERLFEYESRKPFTISEDSRCRLIDDVDPEEFHNSPMPGRIILNNIEKLLEEGEIDMSCEKDVTALKKELGTDCIDSAKFIKSLYGFCVTEPRLPSSEKKFIREAPLMITDSMTRDEIIKRLEAVRSRNRTAELAFCAYRDLRRTDPLPFLTAALNRNPVSAEALKNRKPGDLLNILDTMENDSIYEGSGRIAQPDEVWNFRRGDGLEKALLAGAALRNSSPGNIKIKIGKENALLTAGEFSASFKTRKNLKPQVWVLSPEPAVIPA